MMCFLKGKKKKNWVSSLHTKAFPYIMRLTYLQETSEIKNLMTAKGEIIN